MDGEVWPEGILGTKFVPQTKVFVHKRSGGSKVGNRFEQDDRGEKKLLFGFIHRGSIEPINAGFRLCGYKFKYLNLGFISIRSFFKIIFVNMYGSS